MRDWSSDVCASGLLLGAAFHEWVGIAKDVWAAPGLANKLGYIIREPGWSHDSSRDTSATIRALWQQRQQGEAEWRKPISSSSGADQGAAPPRAACARAANTAPPTSKRAGPTTASHGTASCRDRAGQ